MDKKQTITTERKIGKITYLVQALPSEKATDTIHKKIEKLIVKDLQKKARKSGLFRPSNFRLRGRKEIPCRKDRQVQRRSQPLPSEKGIYQGLFRLSGNTATYRN